MNVFRKDRLAARGGSLVTAIQVSLAALLVPLPPCPQPDFEVLAVKVWLNRPWMHLLNVYSPLGIFPKKWISGIIYLCSSPIIFLGDFNINLLGRDLPLPSRVRQLIDWSAT